MQTISANALAPDQDADDQDANDPEITLIFDYMGRNLNFWQRRRLEWRLMNDAAFFEKVLPDLGVHDLLLDAFRGPRRPLFVRLEFAIQRTAFGVALWRNGGRRGY